MKRASYCVWKLSVFLFAVIPNHNTMADCDKNLSYADVPTFIAEEYTASYLENEKRRQEQLCSTEKSMGNEKAIYIIDNRLDVYQLKGYIRTAANATAALIPREYLTKQGNEYFINHGMTLQKSGWCASEPFASQPVTSTCTAFLVGKDRLVTAGHCLRPGRGKTAALNSWYVVFGFQMKNVHQAQTHFPATDVYQITEVLEVKKNEEQDWAVVKLNRPITGRQVFEFSSKEIAEGTDLTIFGYPNGLPLKIAEGGQVKRNDLHKTVFETDLDSYQGNSGSPVLNAADLRQGRFVVEGVLVSGATDAVRQDQCKVSIICQALDLDSINHQCSGEIVTKINRVLRPENWHDESQPDLFVSHAEVMETVAAHDKMVHVDPAETNSSNLKVLLRTEKNSYHPNERIRFQVKSNKDVYIYLFNFDPVSKTAVLLLPNRLQNKHHIKYSGDGGWSFIPNSNLEFYADQSGVERIVMVASEKFIDIEERLNRPMNKSIGDFYMMGEPLLDLESSLNDTYKKAEESENSVYIGTNTQGRNNLPDGVLIKEWNLRIIE